MHLTRNKFMHIKQGHIAIDFLHETEKIENHVINISNEEFDNLGIEENPKIYFRSIKYD